MKLEAIGKVLAMGFGDKVLAGIFVSLLDGVGPTRVYEYIQNNLELGYWMSDDDWRKYQRMVKSANVKDLTTEEITKQLKKHRLDLLGVIINTKGGNEWLDKQVTTIKSKLGLD